MRRFIALIISLSLTVCLFSCGKGSEPAIDEVTAPEGMPQPIDPDGDISDEEFVCTISISCATILDNTDKLVALVEHQTGVTADSIMNPQPQYPQYGQPYAQPQYQPEYTAYNPENNNPQA